MLIETKVTTNGLQYSFVHEIADERLGESGFARLVLSHEIGLQIGTRVEEILNHVPR